MDFAAIRDWRECELRLVRPHLKSFCKFPVHLFVFQPTRVLCNAVSQLLHSPTASFSLLFKRKFIKIIQRCQIVQIQRTISKNYVNIVTFTLQSALSRLDLIFNLICIYITLKGVALLTGGCTGTHLIPHSTTRLAHPSGRLIVQRP